MQFLTDDDKFGFLVAPMTGHGMFRFQSIIAGQMIGDSEPCILGSAMKQLRNLSRLDDERLAQLSSDPSAVVSTLRFDEDLHDAATLSLSESLDRWMVHGYVYKGAAVMLAQACQEGEAKNPLLVSLVDVAEYDSIVDAVYGYWSKTNGGGALHGSQESADSLCVG